MQRFVGLAAVMLGGCDIVFGTSEIARDDAPVGDVAAMTHDEDADGFVDATDNCPVNAGPQVDTDGDGVGDGCDPHPNVQDRIALFDAYAGGVHAAWQMNGSVTGGADDITLKQPVGSLQYDQLFGSAPIARIHFTNQALTSDQASVGVFIGEYGVTPTNGLECDSYWNGGTLYIRATVWMSSGSTTAANPVGANATDFAIAAHYDTGECVAAFDSSVVTVSSGAPPPASTTHVVITWDTTSASLASTIVYDRH